MNTITNGPSILAGVPPDIAELLGRPPLLRGENREAYNQLLAAVVATLHPHNVLEWIPVWDYTNHTWNIFRLNSMKVQIVNTGYKDAASDLVDLLSDDPDRQAKAAQAAKSWSTEEGKKAIFAEYGIDEEAVRAEALVNRLEEVGRIEQLIAGVESRRRKALQDLELQRQSSFEGRQQLDKVIQPERVPLVPGALGVGPPS